jgi:hypothetical protein
VPPDPTETPWRTSSYSGGNGQCVRLKVPLNGPVIVGDSKDPNGPVLVFGGAAFAAFLTNVKAGDPACS